jgi:PTS system mannose-specific IIC component
LICFRVEFIYDRIPQALMLLKALLAAVIGGFIWLDRFQLLQLMISRPIVSAPIIGWALGDLETGLATGLIFEIVWMTRAPIGGHIPPDSSYAAMATAAIACVTRPAVACAPTAISCLAFLAFMPIAYVGSNLDILLRSRLGKVARGAERRLCDYGEGFGIYFCKALLYGFIYAAVSLFFIISCGAFMFSALVEHLPRWIFHALTFAYYLIPLVVAIQFMTEICDRRNIAIFFIGFALTAIVGFFAIT